MHIKEEDNDTDLGASYDPYRYKARSYKDMVDPFSSIIKNEEKEIESEIYGTIFTLQIMSKSMSSYEIYMLIEDKLNIEIEDLTIIKDNKGKYTGLVIVQLREKVSKSQLQQLETIQFKGKSIATQLYTSEQEYKEFIKSIVLQKLQLITLPMLKSVPLVYVYNFEGDQNDIKEVFSQVGTILLAEQKKDYFILYFSSEFEAIQASRLLNLSMINGKEIKLTLFYPRSVERSFGIRFCNDINIILNMIKKFGKIESSKQYQDGTIYILMENSKSSKKACLWLNNKKIDCSYISTFFIKYNEYKKA
ncbi:hypothetical protein TVAG_100150 [Trichomonas vaginalis G3]|uniref:RRM domain-containing protein n=1 Tax=Trichomonas vaginalis (strain ATCC PRA-98 / G3) TaxID=412133 RepID=A2EK81_TRIV3|nr:RNA-binding domain, RBD family-containing protein [Trichomonas vaginalis G3]EAY06974.1 hypothetical protein TVAG_100150 [Trichomonas vaginalis G3]KAI5499123.1 RNA-binding domain, RBD family-containing protein [Trichomonas vaginalis G3]|eukprot:XP_001319197.1 hypothetical protein [Trichomonas vaginalis G3]